MTAGELDYVLDVGRAHDARIVDTDVHVELVELDVLLRVGLDQVVKLQARDGEHGLAVELGVVEAVEQVDAAGARGGEADAEPAGPLRIGAGVECGSFLVADLDEANLVLVGAQRLDDAVDAVTWNAEHRVDAPVDQGFDEHVAGGRFGHSSLLVDLRESRPRKKAPPRC